MKNVLVVDQNRCNGCRLCMMGCSLHKNGDLGLRSSRIQIVQPGHNVNLALTCNQCEDPVCRTACLMEVIQKNSRGYVVREESACIGCEACAAMCPFGAIHMDEEREVAVSCDLCSGNPMCVSFCPTGALTFQGVSDEGINRREDAAKRMALAVRTSGQIAF